MPTPIYVDEKDMRARIIDRLRSTGVASSTEEAFTMADHLLAGLRDGTSEIEIAGVEHRLKKKRVVPTSCPCGGAAVYNERHDSYFCGTCSTWLETACDCRDCRERPPMGFRETETGRRGRILHPHDYMDRTVREQRPAWKEF